MFLKDYLLIAETKTVVTGQGFWYYTDGHKDILLLGNKRTHHKYDFEEEQSICDALSLKFPLTLYNHKGQVVYEETDTIWIPQILRDRYLLEAKQRTWETCIYRNNILKGKIFNYLTNHKLTQYYSYYPKLKIHQPVISLADLRTELRKNP